MTYKFRRFVVPPSPAYPSGAIYRPVIPIWVGPRGGPLKPYFGLLDTGSDDTKLPLSEAERLGVALDRGHPVPFRGVGGFAVGYYGEVVLELRQSPKVYSWVARAVFLPLPPGSDLEDRTTITLGHAGFFRHFHVGFDYQRYRVELKPNRLFAGQQT